MLCQVVPTMDVQAKLSCTFPQGVMVHKEGSMHGVSCLFDKQVA